MNKKTFSAVTRRSSRGIAPANAHESATAHEPANSHAHAHAHALAQAHKLALALTAILSVTIATGLISSCKKDGVEPQAVKGSAEIPGWTLNADKPVTFKWYINYSWFKRSWGTSSVSKYITKKTGVSIDFLVPGGDEYEELNSMIHSDSMPDIITVDCRENQITDMINSRMVYPLEYLAKEYDPYFFKVASRAKLNWYTQEDGHVYGYPNASFTLEDFNKYKGSLTSHETFLVRKDIYEAIGSLDMSTPEGFINALKMAKEKFPFVNGEALIPFGTDEFTATGCSKLQETLCHFLAIPPEKDGIFMDYTTGLTENAEYIKRLKTFRKAHELSLMPREVFVDKRAQIEEKAGKGLYFALLYYNWDMQNAQNKLYKHNKEGTYIAVKGPSNSNGESHTLSCGGISGWTVTLISKKCKDPARAIQFLTYLISEEGQMDTYFGEKDITYSMVNGKPQLLPHVQTLSLTDKDALEDRFGVLYTYWMLMDSAWEAQWNQKLSPAISQPELWTRPYVVKYFGYDTISLPPNSDENLTYQEVLRRWGTTLQNLILSESDEDFDVILDEYKQIKQTEKYKKLVQLQTQIMKSNKKKLGM